MKNHIKQITKFCTVVIGTLLLFSCEKEQIEEFNLEPRGLPNNTSISVDQSEIPSIVGFLKQKTKNGLEIKLSAKNNTSYMGELDLEGIKAIIHEQGSETYTFNIQDQNRYQSFSNLHVSIRQREAYAYITTYEFDQSFYAHSDLTQFSGTITLSNLEGQILSVTTLKNGQRYSSSGISKSQECNSHIEITHTIPSGDTYVYEEGATCHHPGQCDVAITVVYECDLLLDGMGTGIEFNDCLSCGEGTNGSYNLPNNGLGGNGSNTSGGLGNNEISNIITYDSRLIDNLVNLLGRPIDLEESSWIFSNQQNYAIANDVVSLMNRNRDLETNQIPADIIVLGNKILETTRTNELTIQQAASIFYLLFKYGDSEEAKQFANDAIEALTKGYEVDFEDLYIAWETEDTNSTYTGLKKSIPDELILSNGDTVHVTFGNSSDGVSANQKVAEEIIDGLKRALREANSKFEGTSTPKIDEIYIKTTTNGKHSPTSNHKNGTAIDISRINGVKMILATGSSIEQIKELQKALDNVPDVRENFGPHFKHKYFKEYDTWDYNYNVSGHKDHIHFSIRN
ncbi:hypothetical protein [Aquimarina litoralis]|uniref:hypothetical protein n=1 Tax=Aquimarina litoralis TaxID=584605 RepID=UPI001C5A032E|nr:hypothetical protein [Aquimarina litoralis]MBW1297807.1 hypothetical protein [Aquimarina litoralis]